MSNTYRHNIKVLSYKIIPDDIKYNDKLYHIELKKYGYTRDSYSLWWYNWYKHEPKWHRKMHKHRPRRRAAKLMIYNIINKPWKEEAWVHDTKPWVYYW